MNLRNTGLMNTVSTILTVALILLTAPATSNAQTAGTAFTYQGQLKDGGRPADGEYDLTFSIYDGADTRIAGPIGMENLEVTNGLFTVTLDFGSNVFDGDARFLEIGIRPGDSGASFTRLTPRQELTPTPYAATALKTVGVDGHSLDSADGSHQDAVYVTNYGKVNMSYGGFEVYDEAGHGITFTTQNFSLDAYPSESAAYRYQAAEKRHRFFTDGTNRLEIGPTGNIGIGVTDPNEKLEVAGTVQMDGFKLGTSSTAGHVLTTDANGNGTWQAIPTTTWRKDANDNIHYADGNVGIGMGTTITPAYPLHVEGQSFLNNNVGINTAPTSNALTVNGQGYIDGNVGINTAPTSNALSVNGQSYINGNVGINVLPGYATLSVSGSASVSEDVQADDFEYNIAKVRTLTIPAIAFQPADSGIEYNSNLASIWAESTEEAAYFKAPVYLPSGATITNLSARVTDNSADQDLNIRLNRFILSNSAALVLASVSSDGTPGNNVEISESNIVGSYVSNNSYAYYLIAGSSDWDTGLRIHAVQITYTVNHAD